MLQDLDETALRELFTKPDGTKCKVADFEQLPVGKVVRVSTTSGDKYLLEVVDPKDLIVLMARCNQREGLDPSYCGKHVMGWYTIKCGRSMIMACADRNGGVETNRVSKIYLLD